MAMIEAYRGELAESEEIARQALAMRRREEPDRARESQHLLAKVIGMQDRVDEAIELHLDALSEFEASGSPPDDAYVFGLNELARSYQIVNRLEPAEAILRRAIEAQQRLHPGPHPLTADMLRNLTIVLRHDDRPEQAVEHALRAIEILEALYGEEHALTARMYDTLGTVYRHLEAYDQAEASQRRAIDIQTRLLGADHPEVANSLYNLALLLQRDAGDPDRAEELALESLASSRRSLPPDHVRFGFVLTLLGDVKVSQGRPREALPYLDEALALYRRIYGGVARNWNVAMVESSLGLAHLASGELDRAAEYLERAQPVLDELRGPDNVLSRRCAERRLALYEARGDGSAAAAVRERLGTAPAGLASR
jgi:tetratricopeptide (TPR) repeat protein